MEKLGNLSQTVISKNDDDDKSSTKKNFTVVSEPGVLNRRSSIRINKNLIISPSITFSTEKDWQESSFCYICKNGFDKLKGVFRHHCRVCGFSVCGLCSSKLLNEQRSCDLCFFRVENEELLSRKERFINQKDEKILEAEEKIHKLTESLIKMNTTIQNMEIKNKKEEILQNKLLDEKRREMFDSKRNLEGVLNQNAKINEKLNEKKMGLSGKRDDFDRITKLNKETQFDIERNTEIKQRKLADLEVLLKQLAKTKNSKSFVDIFEYLDLNNSDFDVTSSMIDANRADNHQSFSSKLKRTIRESLAPSFLKPQGKMILKRTISRSNIKDEKEEGKPFCFCFN